MKNLRQGALGFLTALLSVAVILGSFSISLSESGLKLAQNSSLPRISGLRISTMTKPVETTTALPGEANTAPLLTQSLAATFTPMIPSTTPFPSPTSSCPMPDGWSTIMIGSDDTLENLAQTYHTTVEALIQANCLLAEDLLHDTTFYVPGLPPTETIVPCGPPAGWVNYTVKHGDTLFQIGLMFGVMVSDLQNANCMGSSTLIRTGQILFVPDVHIHTPTTQPTRTPKPSPAPTEAPSSTPPTPASPTPIPTRTNTPVPPTFTSTPRPTRTFTPEPSTPTHTNTPTPTATVTPTEASTPTETPTPTATPTQITAPTSTDTDTPTAIPSDTPTAVPTNTPTGTLALPSPRVIP
jgi:LysM repeat protein